MSIFGRDRPTLFFRHILLNIDGSLFDLLALLSRLFRHIFRSTAAVKSGQSQHKQYQAENAQLQIDNQSADIHCSE